MFNMYSGVAIVCKMHDSDEAGHVEQVPVLRNTSVF